MISSIFPNKATPVEKNTIIISGNNFGTDISDIEVRLLNLETDEIAYKLFVREVTDT